MIAARLDMVNPKVMSGDDIGTIHGETAERLKAEGYDGVVAVNSDGSVYEIGVFDADQIIQVDRDAKSEIALDEPEVEDDRVAGDEEETGLRGNKGHKATIASRLISAKSKDRSVYTQPSIAVGRFGSEGPHLADPDWLGMLMFVRPGGRVEQKQRINPMKSKITQSFTRQPSLQLLSWSAAILVYNLQGESPVPIFKLRSRAWEKWHDRTRCAVPWGTGAQGTVAPDHTVLLCLKSYIAEAGVFPVFPVPAEVVSPRGAIK